MTRLDRVFVARVMLMIRASPIVPKPKAMLASAPSVARPRP